jgi:acyl transferase domain-containing protein
MTDSGIVGDELGDDLDIAVVGLAGRFPMAPDVATFWSNLQSGACAVTRFTDEELRARGVDPRLLDDPAYVKAGYLLPDSDSFDAAFFGYSPREAELMDPQHRVLLECAWSVLESAGHDPAAFDGLIGVYAGAGHNTYLLHNVATQPGIDLGDKQVVIGNRTDFVTSRVSYKLNLTGPSVNVQTACSTSLVAVVQASQALLSYQCDMAVAGGVSVDGQRVNGYRYSEDGILSPDGLCRALDRRAQGTVGGDGVGLVVLKRLADALADNDHIHAVIKGGAVNNDGAHRAGFTAPSAVTQAEVISSALRNAGVDAGSVRLVELHGTGTALGDPIEVKALTQVFDGVPAGHCTLGAVKTNVGHLDSAAGVAGLIKAVLAVEHGVIPPTVHFEEANPRLGLGPDGPFRVATVAEPWPADGQPRRAAVSAFGLGGTNAHVVIEQPPAVRPTGAGDRPFHLLTLSARTAPALEAATDRLADHLRAHPDAELTDVAFTLQRGRRAFAHRRTLVSATVAEAVDALTVRDDGRVLTAVVPETGSRPVGFVFTGFGGQYPGMGHELYRAEPAFAAAVDECAELLRPMIGWDVRETMFDPTGPTGTPDPRRMMQPQRSQDPRDRPTRSYPAIFTVDWALARLWADRSVTPRAMIGHSLGEYVAACLAGVFTLPDALALVVERARLIEAQGEGAMLAVPLDEQAVAGYLDAELSLAAVNAPRTCVVSGPVEAIERLVDRLYDDGVAARMLTSAYAFHSPAMDPVVEAYTEIVSKVARSAPTIPFVSNVTGTWISDTEAVDPRYWARHVREPVRFSDGIATLWGVDGIAMVEVGPGQTLTPGVRQHPAAARQPDRVVVPSMPGAAGGLSEPAGFEQAAARLWLAGRPHPFPTGPARRVPLPTYPFQRRRYWLEPGSTRATPAGRRAGDQAAWLHTPSWRRMRPPVAGAGSLTGNVLFFVDDAGVGDRLADAVGAAAVRVRPGDHWQRDGDGTYRIDPADPEHYRRLMAELEESGRVPDRVVHCWGVDPLIGLDDRAVLDRTFHSLVFAARASEATLMVRPQRWDLLTTEVYPVLGTEAPRPAKATVAGLARVLGQEYPALTAVHHDLDPGWTAADLAPLRHGLAEPAVERTVAYRGAHRWQPEFVPGAEAAGTLPVVPGHTYLITGGLGKIGLVIAETLARQERVRLVLTGRTGRPDGDAAAAVRRIEEWGSTVRVAAVDVADRAGMAALIADLGEVNGVVHAAGNTGPAAHRELSKLGPEEIDWHFRPKLHGPAVLHEVLAGRRLDFALLCSSIAAVLGGIGFGAYAAANAALDAFAHRHHTGEQPWTTVNWEAWLFTDEERVRDGPGAEIRELALTPAEGAAVTLALLRATPQPQLVVSTGDLARRRAMWSAPMEAAPERARHERPNLRNPYVAPAGDTETRVAGIWQELLGVDQVGVHDNFFELGGSSLLGLQVVHRLRQELSTAVPLTVVYEGPTVRTLARLIDARRDAR